MGIVRAFAWPVPGVKGAHFTNKGLACVSAAARLEEVAARTGSETRYKHRGTLPPPGKFAPLPASLGLNGQQRSAGNRHN